jgi:group I intron endonuclease
MKIVGVYVVRCVATGMRYVGSSGVSVWNRISYHKAALRKGYHHNPPMQHEYAEHGEESFVFEVTPCSADERLKEEQKKIDYWSSRGKCYNRHPNADSARGVKHARSPERSTKAFDRCTPEWRAAVSLRVKEQHAAKKFGRSTWTAEAEASMSAKLKGRPSVMLGKHHTEEARAKISARHKGVPKSAEHVAKLSGEYNHNYGKPSPRRGTSVSEESRQKMRVAAAAREAAKKLNRKGA